MNLDSYMDSPPESSSPSNSGVDNNATPGSTDTHAATTPSHRIADLNQIDRSISTLLSSASTATSILSNQHPSPLPSSSLSTAQTSFTAATSLYFSTLSSIEVRLRRQIYALEEAGLIKPGDERDARRGRTLQANESVGRRGGGGAAAEGGLDPSWLNARASEGVEDGKRREALQRGREVIEQMRKVREGGGGKGRCGDGEWVSGTGH